MLRCFLSLEGVTLTFSPALRLVCHMLAKILVKLFHMLPVTRNIERKGLTTRWPSIPVAVAYFIGGRLREEIFLQQGQDFEPPWLMISSSSPVVSM